MSALFSVSKETLEQLAVVEAVHTAKIIATTSKAIVLNGKDDVPVVVALTSDQLKGLKVGNIITFDVEGNLVKAADAAKPGKPYSGRQTPNHAPVNC